MDTVDERAGTLDALAHPDYPQAERMPSARLVGDVEYVNAGLDLLAERTGADELMVTSVAYDLDARLRNLTLLVESRTA